MQNNRDLFFSCIEVYEYRWSNSSVKKAKNTLRFYHIEYNEDY